MLCELFSKYTWQLVCGLNPCFNGICSASRMNNIEKSELWKVLILVLMEYALREVDDDYIRFEMYLS